ncbi:MAG: hypothetical protein M3Y55_10320, partial [Pseudomonadota bacterium]|nr:hypothetical protein [Pseudomonadota bacterium]
MLQRRGLLALIASLPVFGRSAEPGPPSFELVPQPRVGQEMRFHFERTTTRNGTVMQRYRMPISVKVIDVSLDGTLLRWTEGEAEVLDADPQRRPQLAIGLSLMRDVPLDVRLDAMGRVWALDNVSDVRKACLGMIDRLLTSMGADGGQRAVVDAMRPALLAAFATEHAVAVASLKEPQLLLGAMGRRFGADEPVQFRTELDNPLGKPLPAIARFSIRRVQRRSNQAELGWLMVSDPAATTSLARTAASLATAIAAAATAKGTIAQDAAETPSVALEERGDFIVDTRTSLAHL